MASIKFYYALYIFLFQSVLVNCDSESCSIKEKECQWPSPDQPSILVKGTDGNLGNAIFAYLVLLIIKMKYGLQVYFTQKKWQVLNELFDDLEITSAEDSICHFKQDFQDFSDQRKSAKLNRIQEHIRLLSNNPDFNLPKDGYGKPTVTEELFNQFDIGSIVHNSESELYNVSMAKPWLTLSKGNIDQLKNHLKGQLIYDHALHAPELSTPEDIPGLESRLEKNLKLRPKYLDMANVTLDTALKSLRISKKQKKKLVLVGIHVRRGDYISYENAKGIPHLKPSYFLQAMDKFRDHFNKKKVVFLLITDDIPWCKDTIAKRNTAKDMFIASNDKHGSNGVGHDLAVMSLCQHAILSRGTFSFWGGFLSGGLVILPCHFSQNPSSHDLADICYRDPLKNPLKRLRRYVP